MCGYLLILPDTNIDNLMKRTFSFFSALFLFLGLAAQPKIESVTYKRFMQAAPPLECIGRIQPRPSGTIPATRWSIGCECLDRNYSRFAAYADELPALGVGFARIQSGWARTEQKKGKYDFAWLDEVVDGLCRRSITPWMCLCYGNPLYIDTDASLGSVIFGDGPVMDAWLRYVEAVVKRYQGRIDCWEVWNEPNIKDNKSHPERYQNLLVRTCEAIRKVDSGAHIAAFGLASFDMPFFRSVLDGLKAEGRTGLFDYVTLHKYYENPDDADVDFALFEDAVRDFDPSVRIIMGESGCPSQLGWAHALKLIEWDEYRQAKVVLRRMACDFRLGHPSSIFTIADNNCREIHFRQSFGLLCTDLEGTVIYRKPSFYGVQSMVNLLPDTVRPVELDYTANTVRTLKVVGLEDDGGRRIGLMMWYADNAPVSALDWDRVTLTVEDHQVKDPVFVEPVTGRVFALDRYHRSPNATFTKYTDVPVWDAPVFILSAEALSVTSADDTRSLEEF